jgi:hypothetical protein
MEYAQDTVRGCQCVLGPDLNALRWWVGRSTHPPKPTAQRHCSTSTDAGRLENGSVSSLHTRRDITKQRLADLRSRNDHAGPFVVTLSWNIRKTSFRTAVVRLIWLQQASKAAPVAARTRGMMRRGKDPPTWGAGTALWCELWSRNPQNHVTVPPSELKSFNPGPMLAVADP